MSKRKIQAAITWPEETWARMVVTLFESNGFRQPISRHTGALIPQISRADLLRAAKNPVGRAGLERWLRSTEVQVEQARSVLEECDER